MGSRLSTPSHSSSTSITGAPHLPHDIHFEIISHLSPDRDRQTLLSAALCCNALCHASQRILFHSMRVSWMDFNDTYRILSAHIKFLQTIVNSPDRLALFVQSYSQVSLALEPSFLTNTEAQRLDNKRDRVKLWNLTANALPLMVNLKNIYFKPSWDHPSAPILLKHCTFQLESFTWMGKGNEERLFGEFLPNQPGLLHLDINTTSFDEKKVLPNGLCPTLVSVSCTFSGFAQIAENRPITAFHIVNSIQDIARPIHVEKRSPPEKQQYLMALKRLKYLHLWSLSQFQPLTSGVSLDNVIVLELTLWQVTVLSQEMSILATQFPQLRILRLWDHYPSSTDTDPAIRNEAATEAFAQCPKLEAVILSSRSKNSLTWEFSKGKEGDVKEETTDARVKEFDRGVWWKVYDM
ncbi:hypothetical protein D9619_013644 [Psilocybe cf. subviscida]|uniref:Uncharacterized protein n=1 Tax=Psilocybe cf. subviscida TaxID=2480587 RepID=A0A8H5BRL9_9AGAR|nr:hypothetical protein D9619_013644 [Psilocybe cf. subviscida]